MKKYEFSAKNVQDAISKGLKELNVKQEDVDIKILNEGGLFKKAQIAILVEAEEEIKEIKKELKKETKQKAKEIKKEAKKEKKETKEVKKEIKETTNIINTIQNNERKSVNFIETLAQKLGAEVSVTTSEAEGNLFVDVNGEKAGVLIGYRGEALTAIQYLANTIEQQNKNKEEKLRVILNVENYKQKREEALRHLARSMASKVIKTGRYKRLEPMNAYERRIIHAELTDSEVATHSKGVEPRRYVVIEPKK